MPDRGLCSSEIISIGTPPLVVYKIMIGVDLSLSIRCVGGNRINIVQLIEVKTEQAQ